MFYTSYRPQCSRARTYSFVQESAQSENRSEELQIKQRSGSSASFYQPEMGEIAKDKQGRALLHKTNGPSVPARKTVCSTDRPPMTSGPSQLEMSGQQTGSVNSKDQSAGAGMAGAGKDVSQNLQATKNSDRESEATLSTVLHSADELQKRLQDSEAKNKQLEQRIREATERAERAEANENAMRMQHPRHNEVRVLRKQLEDFQHNANHQIMIRNQEIEALQAAAAKTHRDAQESIELLTVEHSGETAKRDAQVRQLLDKVTRDKVEGKWNPLPDDEIRHKFNLLNSDIRDWAKHWAVKSLDLTKLSPQATTMLCEFMNMDPKKPVIPPLLTQPSTAAKWRERLGPMLLHGALSHEIHLRFFDNPYFFIKEEHQKGMNAIGDEMEKGELGLCLLKAVSNVSEADKKEFNIWRTIMWRLLNPPMNVALSREASAVVEKTRNDVRSLIDKIDADFRKSPAKELLAPCDNPNQKQERAAKLRKILASAADIASILFTQHPYLLMLDLVYLLENRVPFSIHNRFLEGHPLSKVDVDDDSHEGEGIIVVTRPALLAFDEDDNSGIEGDRFRVLEKATVLLAGRR